MANRPTKSAPAARAQAPQQSDTLEHAAAVCPHKGLADNLARTFALDPVPFDEIREATEEHVGAAAKMLEGMLNERALQIHLQRVVGAHVSSAAGAGRFYGEKLMTARNLTTKLGNEDRDEDRDGVYGFESKAERARLFAARVGLQAYALLAAATGAVHAYASVIGEDWKPYEKPAAASRSVSRQSAAAELAAFGV